MLERTAVGGSGPRSILVSGEAGIRKSRLLAALREHIAPAWMVLESLCFKPYSGLDSPPAMFIQGEATSRSDSSPARGSPGRR